MTIKDGDFTLKEWRPDLGRTTWEYFDGVDLHTRVDYDLTALINKNRILKNDAPSKHTRSKEGVGELVASIPEVIFWEHLAEATRQNDQKYINRFIDDYDNSAFKVR
jgi:hypothetical protein